MRIKGVLPCLLILLATGCGGDDDANPTATSGSSAILSNSYLPAQQGAVWRYDVQDSNDTIQITSSNVVKANGKETVDLTWSHSSFKQSLRLQDNALYIDKIHLNTVTVENQTFEVDLDLSGDPALLLPEFAVMGPMQTLDSYHNMGVKISPDVGQSYGNYLTDWSYEGTETVTTSTGNYEALHIHYRLFMNVIVQLNDQNNTRFETQIPLIQDLWLAPGIGIVKLVDKSASVNNPLVAVLSNLNKYRDLTGNISALPDSVSIPAESPWKNSHQAYKLDKLYGDWASSYTCNESEDISPSFQLSLSENSYTLSTKLTNNDSCSESNAREYVESGTYQLLGFDPTDNRYLSLNLLPRAVLRNEYQMGQKTAESPDTPNTYSYSIFIAKGENATIKLGLDNVRDIPSINRVYTNLTAVDDGKEAIADTLAMTRRVYFGKYDELNNLQPEENFTGWGMQIWNDGTCDSIMDSQLAGITWNNALAPAGYDPAYGLYFDLQIKEGHNGCANFIIHRGGKIAESEAMTVDLAKPEIAVATLNPSKITYH